MATLTKYKYWDYLKAKKPSEKYYDGYADYEGKRVYDREVYEFIFKHLRVRDAANPRKVVECAIMGQLMLFGVIPIPEGDWKFYRDYWPNEET